MTLQKASTCIDKALDKIVSTFVVERVILFGSFACGTPGFDSDIDLLVVMDTNLPSYERAVPIRKALRDVGFPFDIIVRTPREFTRYKNVVGTIV
ncbi:MAG: nucleotidyltransferase domain-containing protein [Candidatus Magnetobacterium sp. LHC-1]|nr:nucleotidyltransferase domain-containing protein [Nitrospirota bacterium]